MRKLEERGVDLDRLYDMQEKDIGALIRYAPGGKVLLIVIVGVLKLASAFLYFCSIKHGIYCNFPFPLKLVKQYLGYFPMVQLFATVSPITRTVLKVNGTLVMFLFS